MTEPKGGFEELLTALVIRCGYMERNGLTTQAISEEYAALKAHHAELERDLRQCERACLELQAELAEARRQLFRTEESSANLYEQRMKLEAELKALKGL